MDFIKIIWQGSSVIGFGIKGKYSVARICEIDLGTNVQASLEINVKPLLGYGDCTGQQIMKASGECVTCDEYTKPTLDMKQCKPDECTLREVIKIDGTCLPCDDYQVPDED